MEELASDDVEESPEIDELAVDDVEEKNVKNGGSVVDKIVAYESDFSLRLPISSVRFRGCQLNVIDTANDQIILKQQLYSEENKENKKAILVKRLSPATYAQRSLRIGYTLITVIFVGFVFVFCCQVFLFLAIALPTNSDQIWSIPKLAILLSLLSLPVMLYGLTSLMTMGCAFVVDSYRGGALFRSTTVEIIYMLVFLIAPIMTLMICLMSRNEEPWRITALVWAILISITFAIWSLAVTYKEIKACFMLVDRCFPLEEEEPNKLIRFMKTANRALLITQTERYSGTRRQRYLVAGDELTKNYTESELTPVESRTSFFSCLVSLKCCLKMKTFDTVDPPKKVLEPDEIMGYQPVMTKNNWSMQKFGVREIVTNKLCSLQEVLLHYPMSR